jgi:antitoxin CcdA
VRITDPGTDTMARAPRRKSAAKKAVNLSVNADLLRQAREREINLSSTLERALQEALRERRRAQWLTENRDGIRAYNQRVDRDGAFADTLRDF